jgi:hypothetical protein
MMINIMAILPQALAQSTGHSRVCEKEQGPGNPGCVSSFANPSNPNSYCNSGREFGANHTGFRC